MLSPSPALQTAASAPAHRVVYGDLGVEQLQQHHEVGVGKRVVFIGEQQLEHRRRQQQHGRSASLDLSVDEHGVVRQANVRAGAAVTQRPLSVGGLRL